MQVLFLWNYTPRKCREIMLPGTNQYPYQTNGYTKQYSGVNLDSLWKIMTFPKKYTKVGIQKKPLAEAIEIIMAEMGRGLCKAH